MTITINGIRNAMWCAVAFGIVAWASTPTDKLAVAQTELSQKRADAVATAASNNNPGSRQLNRSVEIAVSNGDLPIPAGSGAGTP